MRRITSLIALVLLGVSIIGCGEKINEEYELAVQARKDKITELQTYKPQVRELLKQRDGLVKDIDAIVGDKPPEGPEFEAKMKKALEGQPPVPTSVLDGLPSVNRSTLDEKQKSALEHLEKQLLGMSKEIAIEFELKAQIRILQATLKVVQQDQAGG